MEPHSTVTTAVPSLGQSFYITPNMINSLSTLQVGRVLFSLRLLTTHLDVSVDFFSPPP